MRDRRHWRCEIVKGNLRSNVTSVAFTIERADATSALYDPLANHDVDADSDGTTIVVPAP